MNKIQIALGALVLLAAPALSGCETNTEVTPGGETVTTPGIDDGVEAGVSAFGDSVASGAAQTADQIQEGAANAGAAVQNGAANAGAAVQNGAQNAADAVDENVDLGPNAEKQP